MSQKNLKFNLFEYFFYPFGVLGILMKWARKPDDIPIKIYVKVLLVGFTGFVSYWMFFYSIGYLEAYVDEFPLNILKSLVIMALTFAAYHLGYEEYLDLKKIYLYSQNPNK